MKPLTAEDASSSFASVTRDYLELSKSRIVLMVLMTTAAGFLVASFGNPDMVLLLHTLIGTAFVAAGTNALNQYVERDLDAMMHRTRTRPLPEGRITPQAALGYAVAIVVAGSLYLAVTVNMLTSLLGLATMASYLFAYTPLKRTTTLSTIVGAVPGAIPPLMGWSAARGSVEYGGWLLFAILFLWQLPHFLAIGWLYRDDYARAGYAILSVKDSEGRVSGRQAILYTLALIPISLFPSFFGLAGKGYLPGALAAGLFLLVASVAFAKSRTMKGARNLFVASIVYLPVIMLLLVASSSR